MTDQNDEPHNSHDWEEFDPANVPVGFVPQCRNCYINANEIGAKEPCLMVPPTRNQNDERIAEQGRCPKCGERANSVGQNDWKCWSCGNLYNTQELHINQLAASIAALERELAPCRASELGSRSYCACRVCTGFKQLVADHAEAIRQRDQAIAENAALRASLDAERAKIKKSETLVGRIVKLIAPLAEGTDYAAQQANAVLIEVATVTAEPPPVER